MSDQTPETSAAPLSVGAVRELLTELRAVHGGRNGEYATARELYFGRHWGLPGSEKPEAINTYTITLNYIRPTVDKSVQLLLGQMPGVQVMPPGTDEMAARLAEAEEALLYATWEQNGHELVFRRLAHNMSLLRRGVLYFWWDPKKKIARFRSISPDNFYPIYDGEDIVEAVVVSRRLTRTLRRAYPKLADKIVPDQDTDDVYDEGRWTRMIGGQLDALSSDAASTQRPAQVLAGQTTVIDWYDRDGNWVRVMGDASHSQKLAYDIERVPFIEFVNSLPGDEREPVSDIVSISDLNLYLNQLISQSANVIRKYSNPTIIDKQSGQSVQDIRQAVQGDGGVLPIKRDGNIELLNWQGQTPDIGAQYERVMTAIHDLSGKPQTSYGQMMSNQSGVATNMSLSPATTTTEEKQGIFGLGLQQLNEVILRLNEKFMAGEQIEVRASQQRRPGTQSWRFYDVQLRGSEIGGWYKNRIKWPSALRTDDPIYVQNELSKSSGDASNPPKQSLYTTLENLGVEDVEAEIDRIARQLEDPRLHPERLQAAIGAAQAMQQSQMSGPMAGLDPAVAAANGGGPALDNAMTASGNPAGPKSQAGGGRGTGS